MHAQRDDDDVASLSLGLRPRVRHIHVQYNTVVGFGARALRILLVHVLVKYEAPDTSTRRYYYKHTTDT